MKKLILAATAALLSVGTASAEMVSAQDPQSIASVLREAGYKAEMTKDSSGDPMIRSSAGGSNFAIFFFGCTNNRDCRTIQFYAGYSDKNTSYSKINEWNSNNRFGRAYVTEKGAARVEMDVDMDDGGMSSKLFEDNLEFWVIVMGKFEKFIG